MAVCPGVTELYALKHDMKDSRVRQKVTAQSVGRRWCLRSKEYLAPTKAGKAPKGALKWRDIIFRGSDHEILVGPAVANTKRITASVLSSKNKLERCTRTTVMVDSDPLDAVKMLTFEYMNIYCRTGKPPDREAFVFELEDSPGKVLSRAELSEDLQNLLQEIGVPKRLAGTHSLRRGGATMMRVAGVPDEDIKRWGRWTSDAYKLYVGLDVEALDKWQEAIAKARPVYEFN